jgi:hypothetical protein
MDHALLEVMKEIKDLHKCYKEQEVIKDRDVMIELIDELLSEDSDGDGNDGGDDDLDEEIDLEEVP